MLKASDIMTRALVVCDLDTTTAEAAGLMRDRDIGDVLIVDNGKLKGIVTDRDLATKALTSKDNPQETPVRKYMTDKVVVGEPDWNVNKIASVMAKNQIRRLPILEHGRLAGLISLGDVALHSGKEHAVAKSLQAISKPEGGLFRRRGFAPMLMGLALAATATTVIALRTKAIEVPDLRDKRTQEQLKDATKRAVSTAKEKLSEVASDDRVQSLAGQVRSRMKMAS